MDDRKNEKKAEIAVNDTGDANLLEAASICVPLDKKLCLSVQEASAYSGIGVKTIELMLREPNCKFLLMVGNRRYVKRELFVDFINDVNTRKLATK